MKRRWFQIVIAAVLALPIALLVVTNLFVNISLPFLLNQKPERVKITYNLAWTVIPGNVHVYGLKIRSQGPKDQWLLEADRAFGVIDLQALREQRLVATRVKGEGVSLRYRFRAAPGTVGKETAPPIKGLENPPDPIPEEIYTRGTPWVVDVPDAVLGMRELWVEDYRYTGKSRLAASVFLGGAEVDAKVSLAILDGGIQLGEAPVATNFHGNVELTVDKLPRQAGLGRTAFGNVSAVATLDADVQNLSFFQYYLAKAPWLAVDGAGTIKIDVAMDSGRFREKSYLTAQTRDLSVKFMSYDVRGDGVVHLEVTDDLEVPMSRLAVDFGAYTISETGQLPLVEGTGFSVDVMSPDISLDEPFTTLDVVLDLPESEVRNIELYNAFFPEDIGFALKSGTGKVRGRLTASTLDNIAEGDVYIDGDDLSGRLDDLGITLDLALHARLSEGRLAEGLYDFSGTRLELRNVGMVDRAPTEGGREHDETRSWWATVDIPDGHARIGKPIYLDATVVLRCADSVPFIRVLSQRKELANWVQGLLTIPDIRGRGRVKLGADTVSLDGFQVTGGNYEVLMRWYRQRRSNKGSVFARYGKLSVGIGVDGDDQQIHVFKAREWFMGGEAAESAAAATAAAEGEKNTRKEDRQTKKADAEADATATEMEAPKSKRRARERKEGREPRRD